MERQLLQYWGLYNTDASKSKFGGSLGAYGLGHVLALRRGGSDKKKGTEVLEAPWRRLTRLEGTATIYGAQKQGLYSDEVHTIMEISLSLRSDAVRPPLSAGYVHVCELCFC